MYLHIGFDTLVRKKDIVGIFDLDTTTVSQKARDFLNKAEKNKQTLYINNELLPKSFIITTDKKVFLSPLASSTLRKRNT